MKQLPAQSPKNYYWKRDDGRYYKILEHPTLFGNTSLVCCWGNIKTKLGNYKVYQCNNSLELEKTIKTISKTRKRHGYVLIDEIFGNNSEVQAEQVENTKDVIKKDPEVKQVTNYKIIKEFERVECYNQPDNTKKLIGLFLDVETTGTSAEKDKIIELALVPFEYSEDGKIYRILPSYTSFQDPGFPIPKFIEELTGINDEMVAGKSLDASKIEEIVSACSIIIAHHAAFDKKFVEKIFPFFANKLWACTVAHIDWKMENIASSKLEYLAYKFEIFYEAHRAEIDSLIGIHILAQRLPVSSELAMKTLLNNATCKYCRIWAEHAPFASKDILKARGYKWHDGSNGKSKSWYKIIKEDLKDEELNFLYNEVYGNTTNLKIDSVHFFEIP